MPGGRSLPSVNEGSLKISVLGGFQFRISGRDVMPALTGGTQRLLAFLALHQGPVVRSAAAGMLWPEATDDRAYASLRSAISRLTLIARDTIVVSYQDVRLAEHVTVDIRAARALAQRLLKAGKPREGDLRSEAIGTLSADLLPDWYDDWAVIEAEDWRQLRLHALDALTERLIAGGSYADATSAAHAAVKAEPLREASQAALIRVHLAEGNRAEALAAFESYRDLLRVELGLAPTTRIQALIKDLQILSS
jgi:DNA-binding SARP family transcriptional activator